MRWHWACGRQDRVRMFPPSRQTCQLIADGELAVTRTRVERSHARSEGGGKISEGTGTRERRREAQQGGKPALALVLTPGGGGRPNEMGGHPSCLSNGQTPSPIDTERGRKFVERRRG